MTSTISIDCNFLSFSSYCYAFVMGTIIYRNLCGFVMDHLDCADVAVGRAEADPKVVQKSVSFCDISMLTVRLLQCSQHGRLLCAVVLYFIFCNVLVWIILQNEGWWLLLIWHLISCAQVLI